jgi:hypothetical protein
MIDGINSLTSGTTASRAYPQAAVSATAGSGSSTSFNPGNISFFESRIRMDNLQNVAILEIRSSEGEVVNRYPTEQQVAAFRRAEELRDAAASEAHQAQAQQLIAQETAQYDAPEAPQPQQQAAPAPTQAAPVQTATAAPSITTAAAPAPAAAPSQSVLV